MDKEHEVDALSDSSACKSQAVLLLEAAQQRRKVSAGLRIAAAGLYSVLGAPSLASQHLAALEIKHIQHDTLSGQRPDRGDGDMGDPRELVSYL